MKLSSLLIFCILFSESAIEQTAVVAYGIGDRTFDPEDVSIPSNPDYVKALHQQASDPTDPSENYSKVSKLFKRFVPVSDGGTPTNHRADPGLKSPVFDGTGDKVRDVSTPGDDSKESEASDSYEAECDSEHDSNSTVDEDNDNDTIEQDPDFEKKVIDFYEISNPESKMYLIIDKDFSEFESAEPNPISIDKKFFLEKLFEENELPKHKQYLLEATPGESNDFGTKTIELSISPDSLGDFLKLDLSTLDVLHLLVFYDDTGVKYVTKVDNFDDSEEPQFNYSKLNIIQISLKSDAFKNKSAVLSTSTNTNPKSRKVKCYFKPNRENEIEKGPDCVYHPWKVDSEAKKFQYKTVVNTSLHEETNVTGRGTNSTSESKQPNKITHWILNVLCYIMGKF